MPDQSLKKNIELQALKILKIRENSFLEIKNKLTKKFPDNEVLIQEVLTEFKNKNYLSDRRFAEMYLRSKKNKGKHYIKMELLKKGISEEMVSETFRDSGYDELENAEEAAAKKFSSLLSLPEQKQKERLMRFLYSRGFSKPVIYEILNSRFKM